MVRRHHQPQGESSAVSACIYKFKPLLEESFAQPETIKVACDVHDWMSAYIVATEHPYYVLTDRNGAFELTDVPAGT